MILQNLYQKFEQKMMNCHFVKLVKLIWNFSYFGICPILGGRMRTDVFSEIEPEKKIEFLNLWITLVVGLFSFYPVI